MTDLHLRELERRFNESGGPDDERAFLLACVRAGERLDPRRYTRLAELSSEGASMCLLARVADGSLPLTRLGLLAHCAHEPARLALGRQTPKVAEDLAAWVRELERWGRVACVRAARAAAASALDALQAQRPDDPAPSRALLAVDAWLEQPSEEGAQLAAAAGVAAFRTAAADLSESACHDAALAAAWAAAQVAARPFDAEDAVRAALASTATHPPALVRGVICVELVEWALREQS